MTWPYSARRWLAKIPGSSQASTTLGRGRGCFDPGPATWLDGDLMGFDRGQCGRWKLACSQWPPPVGESADGTQLFEVASSNEIQATRQLWQSRDLSVKDAEQVAVYQLGNSDLVERERSGSSNIR